MNYIYDYFPDFNPKQKQQLESLYNLYKDWNSRINVISRKDIDYFYLHHVLHSLSIAKFIKFRAGSQIMDVGSGGGFPGVPLAIMFPQTEFVLVDSIGKKIKVVNEVAQALSLENVSAHHLRAERIQGRFDFVVTRAVTKMPGLVQWTQNKISQIQKHSLKNGILALKGGDLTQELNPYPKAQKYLLSDHFDESFFDTKQVIHLPLP